MERLIFRSRGVHLVGNGVQPSVLDNRSNQCSSPRSLVVCGQQRDVQCSCEVISNSLFQESIAHRRQESSKYCASSTLQHTIFSTKLTVRKQSRITRNGLASDTGSNSEATVSSKTGGWSLTDKLSDALKADELGRNIALIALPAAIGLASDPIASLVDTAFVGKIGPVELAAVGVSISVFNLVSKMFNVPLLNVTTSFVAEDASDESPGSETSKDTSVRATEEKKLFLPAISSALVLGTLLGVAQTFVMSFLAGPVLNIMGVGLTSPMRTPAMEYLALRGLGAPAVVIALAIQGVFRGFKDTKTPLYASVAGNFANIALDPILMFSFNLGVRGAAIATVVSQYLIAGLLLWKLNKRVVLLPNRWKDLPFNRFLSSGGYLLGRTIAFLMCFTLATSMAARQGPIIMAAHQICVQIWLAISLLSDSLALAGQTIVASAFAKNDYKLVKEAAIRVLQIGCGLGVLSALVVAFGMPAFSTLFTNDDTVLRYIRLLLPFVALTQPINALAFIFDGLHYGASDFEYVAVSAMALVVPAMLVLLFLPKFWGISAVWVGMSTAMTLRMLTGFWRMNSTTGPWKFLNQA
ncbi:hypothetical protein KC19_3G155300 [Ceratodon purpureus]|uniref:Protein DETOXIFICATION n=1 Tax=Ceratodon purpureus TaxID=3225 RepID=A0A8T0IIT9_CERPU|nr:hypothetical protein KC19_3G155300 [Ceratodon purpureus]